MTAGCSGGGTSGTRLGGNGGPDGSVAIDGGFSDTADGSSLEDAGRPPGCVPKTCKELEKNCGFVADGCGGVVQCGTCAKGTLCGIEEHNVCTATADLCKPESKAAACKDKECGATSDGCGGTYDCGSCGNGELCGYAKPFQCDAPPTSDTNNCPAKIASCASVGAECGQIGNGCGGLIDCNAELGGCMSGEACGIDAPEKCGALPSCTPLTADVACAGKCGVVGDGCGATSTSTGLIDCDADPAHKCPTGQSCGAGGVANQCGDASNGACSKETKAAACGSAVCGVASDGCDGTYTCGSCGSGQLCQNGACVAACTAISKTTACSGKECGLVSDGCSGSYDCGTCAANEQCGLKTAYQCDTKPPTACVPLTASAACAGKQCGTVYDGCGSDASHQIDCATVSGGCSAGTFCGVKTPYKCDAPPSASCTAAGSCAALGWACGIAVDSCGNTYDCALEGRSCNTSTETCMGGITGPTTCQAGSGGGGGTCTVCGAIPDCSAKSQVTKLTGRVITPGKTDSDTDNQVGVPNAFVYILQSDDTSQLPAIDSGMPSDGKGGWLTACDRCDDQNLGSVLTSAITDAKGDFTLQGNIPVNQEFVLVVKIGKWRRAQKYTVASGNACKTSAIPTTVTRLPRTRSDGPGANIPRTAISTGKVDAMECVLYKMGVAQSEFALPGNNGSAAARVHMYRSTDAGGEKMGSGTTAYTDYAPDTDLYQDATRLNSYDTVVFDCEGSPYEDNTYDVNLREYVNRGGRMFASHWSYTWLHDNGTLNYATATAVDTRLDTSATWQSSTAYPSSGTGYISVGRPQANTTKIGTFASWLLNEGSVTQSGTDYTFTITDPRDLAVSVNSASEEWVYRYPSSVGTCSCPLANILTCGLSGCGNATSGSDCGAIAGCSWAAGSTTVQQYSFNTPLSAPSDNICGRVAYSAFHVTPAGGSGSFFTDVVFPSGCSGNLTSQEKVLLFMLFDLSSCVSNGGPPPAPTCTPLSKGSACTTGICGEVPNGCGGTYDCGDCPSGESCGANHECVPVNCTKTTCAAQGATCGVVADGCGGTLTCPNCPSGQICGLFTPNQCAITCTPVSQASACAGKCGSVSDGCGGVYACGGCSGSLVCINNSCQNGSCTPLTHCPSGLDCGLIGDGCSGSVNCGTCTLPEVCGGGGQANVCGQPACNPLSCSDLSADCGYIGDGCGGSKDCGVCDPGKVCGLAGPNKCGGCNPLSCGAVGAECGAIGDGCGGSTDCGTCPAGKVCGAVTPNKCGDGPACKPQQCSDVGAECGLIGDGCGEVVDCGKCATGEVCGLDSPNKCGAPKCQKLTCAQAGAQCGSIGDGCGGLIDCGPCPSGEACGAINPNRCDGII